MWKIKKIKKDKFCDKYPTNILCKIILNMINIKKFYQLNNGINLFFNSIISSKIRKNGSVAYNLSISL